MVGQAWKSIAQRELEEEMIFRGDQVAEIIYQKLLCKQANMNAGTVNQFMWQTSALNGTVLDDLVIGKEERCANGLTRKFRLRPSAILDPATNKQWQFATPVADVTRFAGVKSESTKEPFKKNFSDLYDSKLLDEKKKYSEWEFTWELKNPPPPAAVKVIQ
jgi:hypothetical protein